MTEKYLKPPETRPKLIPTETLLICRDPLCEKINTNYRKLDNDNKKTVYAIYLILENEILRYHISENKQLEKITVFEVTYPPQAGGKLGLSRSEVSKRLKTLYDIDASESTVKRLMNDKLQVSYEDFVKAVILNIISKIQIEKEKRDKKYVIPTTYDEFLSRKIVQDMIRSMRAQGLRESHINKVIREFYRYCIVNKPEYELTPVDPVWVRDVCLSTPEEIWRRTDRYLQWRIDDLVERGGEPDINKYIALVQAIQKWLGCNLLRPGITQKEYKGKYFTCEIPLKIRDKIVRDLINMYESDKDKIYLRIIQSLIILYYTGSRRMVLIKSEPPRLRIDYSTVIRSEWDEIVKIYNEREFYRVITIEKRDIKFTKIIPRKWGDLVRTFKLFTEDEIYRVTKILKNVLNKYFDELNEDTQRYLKHSKVFHIWRHTSNRDHLVAFNFNRTIVSKLLGWIKEENLKIYGDYSIDEILRFKPEMRKVIFSNLYDEIRNAFKRGGLL
ncbi:MAG: hypothetical protein QW607_12475 [Desulfurococcaceae archaeon]